MEGLRKILNDISPALPVVTLLWDMTKFVVSLILRSRRSEPRPTDDDS